MDHNTIACSNHCLKSQGNRVHKTKDILPSLKGQVQRRPMVIWMHVTDQLSLERNRLSSRQSIFIFLFTIKQASCIAVGGRGGWGWQPPPTQAFSASLPKLLSSMISKV